MSFIVGKIDSIDRNDHAGLKRVIYMVKALTFDNWQVSKHWVLSRALQRGNHCLELLFFQKKCAHQEIVSSYYYLYSHDLLTSKRFWNGWEDRHSSRTIHITLGFFCRVWTGVFTSAESLTEWKESFPGRSMSRLPWLSLKPSWTRTHHRPLSQNRPAAIIPWQRDSGSTSFLSNSKHMLFGSKIET